VKTVQIVTIALVSILSIIIGIFIGNKTKKCPEITIGKETTLVTVLKHDTVNTIKTIKEIVYKQKIVVDTLIRDSILFKQRDTQNCYSVSKIEDDGAYVEAGVCSKNFPPIDSVKDLNGYINYVPGNDTNKIIYSKDTVVINKSKVDRKIYYIGILGVIIVYLSGFISHK
jgi:hypothetical protein